ncbi:hypothetical protein GCM10010123_45260 [Pilimelia anulata]|uniref:DUF3618 domain-containing protein n=1 Tax=Pilimelia anulata TaxID=53371 RepID=A0A8J3BCS9_9ACTN|nr:DUF3618 domain-containing protein [Pilimelia anulata]GGK10261.1 hypothetical protein GCM10010123_45260 [Pilimelia anulata]
MTAQPEQIRREIERTRASLSHDVDALAYKASPTRIVEERKQRLTGTLRGIRDTVMGTADDAGGGLSRATGAVGDTIADTAHAVGEAAADAPAAIRRQTEGNPLAAGLIAFGVGWLVSSLVPGSDPERRAVAAAGDAVEEHAPQWKQQLGEAAGDLTDSLRAPAAEAVTAVRETATEAVDTVRSDAGDAAHAVRAEAGSAADRGGRHASDPAG